MAGVQLVNLRAYEVHSCQVALSLPDWTEPSGYAGHQESVTRICLVCCDVPYWLAYAPRLLGGCIREIPYS